MKMLCNRCGYEGDPLYVHGHTQCQMCRQVIDDCCQGEKSHNFDPLNPIILKDKLEEK